MQEKRHAKVRLKILNLRANIGLWNALLVCYMSMKGQINLTNRQETKQQIISEQQIRFLELLKLSAEELESRISKETEENPALEEVLPEEEASSANEERAWLSSAAMGASAKGGGTLASSLTQEEKSRWMAQLPSTESVEEKLLAQLNLLGLTEDALRCGRQIIGSLDPDGYLRRPLVALANDLRKEGYTVSQTLLKDVLAQIQTFEPAGIAATDLRECLLLQLKVLPKASTALRHARIMVEKHYEAFKKKHFDRIAQQLHLSKEQMQEALDVVLHLNPKPGGQQVVGQQDAPQGRPEFILTERKGALDVQLYRVSRRTLRINRAYERMHIQLQQLVQKKSLNTKEKQTREFLQNHLENGRAFLQSLERREHTLLETARVIVHAQASFLATQDPVQLKPMVLKDIAVQVGVDISTISRIVNNKRIDTPMGVLALKDFFSQTSTTSETNQPVSNKAIKELLRRVLATEDKHRPLSDQSLQQHLAHAGYPVARRTIAKYREQMHIPVARLRKQW